MLFRWCIRRELMDEAQNQIDLLSMMDVQATTLSQMAEKLDRALIDWRARKQNDQNYDTTKLPIEAVADVQQDAEVGQIQQVGYSAPIEIADRLKLIERLENATESIDGEAVVMFKRKIEPLIINSCYTAKCHSNDSMPLPLATLSKSQRIPKRMSQRNLYNVLKYTDFDRPMESKLLAAAALPHAGNSKPIIKINSPQFQNLKIWLIAISSKPFLYHPVPVNFYDADLKVRVNSDEESDLDSPNKAPVLHSIKKLPKGNSHQSDTANQSDPFDPKVFNRLYLKSKDEDAFKESQAPDTDTEIDSD